MLDITIGTHTQKHNKTRALLYMQNPNVLQDSYPLNYSTEPSRWGRRLSGYNTDRSGLCVQRVARSQHAKDVICSSNTMINSSSLSVGQEVVRLQYGPQWVVCLEWHAPSTLKTSFVTATSSLFNSSYINSVTVKSHLICLLIFTSFRHGFSIFFNLLSS